MPFNTLTIFRLVVILMLSFGFENTFSQNARQLKRIETEADQLFQSEIWKEALDVYLLLDSISPKTAEYQFRIGVIYFHSIDKKKSLQYFLDAIKNGKRDVNLNYYLARAYHFNLQFDSALYYYEKCIVLQDSVDILDDDLKRDILKSIEDCQYAGEITNEPLEIPIVNFGLPVNSEFPEYVPLVSADERMIIFTSRRPNTTGKRIDMKGDYMEDIYMSMRNTDGSWSEPDNKLPFNTTGHDACVGLNAEGTRLILYRSDNGGDLFFSEYENNRWSKPVSISNKVNTIHWESSACFSTDGLHLYFTSDKPGGYGGSDIYRASLNDKGEWNNIENLGKIINTSYDEDAPKIHSDDKTLFFSSKGHKSIGGYDIFSSIHNEESGEWGTPRNIGYPINTPGDDIYFTLLNNGEKGFFSSYRPDTQGEKDIYMITRPESVATKFIMKFKLYDHFHDRPITANIIIRNTNTNEEQELISDNQTEGRYTCALDFKSDYVLSIQAPGYKFHEKKFMVDYRADIFEYVMDIAPKKEEVIELIDTISLAKELYAQTLNQTKMNRAESSGGSIAGPGLVYASDILPEEQLNNFSTVESNAQIDQEIQQLQNNQAHTINNNQKASIDKNKNLTNNNTEISSNKNTKMISNDSETNSSDKIITSNSIRPEVTHFHSDEIKNVIGSTTFSKELLNMITRDDSEVLFITRIDTEDKVAIPMIQFDFDKFDLNQDDKNNLDNLSEFLKKNSNLNVIITGHTDSIGREKYNIDLSLYRAGGVRLYLISKGVSRKQLHVMQRGDNIPILNNSTIMGRQVNRRAEMTFIDVNDPLYNAPPFGLLLKDLNIDINPLPGYQTPYVIWEKLPVSVHFKKNNATQLTEYSSNKLSTLVNYLHVSPFRLVITGYMDPNEEIQDINLSGDRANTIRDYFIENGIPENKLILMDNSTFTNSFDILAVEPGISRRRVQFYFVKN